MPHAFRDKPARVALTGTRLPAIVAVKRQPVGLNLDWSGRGTHGRRATYNTDTPHCGDWRAGGLDLSMPLSPAYCLASMQVCYAFLSSLIQSLRPRQSYFGGMVPWP